MKNMMLKSEKHDVAASNNRDTHAMITLLLLVPTSYVWVLLFMHIPVMVYRAFNAMPTKKLQQ